MGFERLCMALQGKSSNYDTDVFLLVLKLKNFQEKSMNFKNEKDIANHVVDHIRAVSFAIADGQLAFKRRCRLRYQKNFKKEDFLFLQILRHERTFPL
jgi:alanyl-tRNA synthetase